MQVELMKYDILVDKVSRDLTFSAYTAALLSALPYSDAADVRLDHQDPYVLPDRYDFFERTRRHVDAIVTPSYNYPRTLNLLARALRQGGSLIEQHSEQFFPQIFNKEKFGKQNGPYNRHVQAHVVWGRMFARQLAAESGIDPSQIYIAGNPKLDLARRLAKNREVTIGRHSVLMVSSFTLADLSWAEWQHFTDQYQVDVDIGKKDVY